MPGIRNSYVAIIDDDESICRSFGRLLRTVGYQPVTYPSAEAFLEDIKRPQFDCLVLDLQLTGMSGLELSRRLAAVNDTTPVVFITAQDDAKEKAGAEADCRAAFLRKTDPGARVLEVIGQTVHRRGYPPTDPGPTPQGP